MNCVIIISLSEMPFLNIPYLNGSWKIESDPLGMCVRPVRGHPLWPLHLSEQAGIINEVAFSWILTSLSAGLPHSLIGAIGLGLGPDRAEAEWKKMSELVPSAQEGFLFFPRSSKVSAHVFFSKSAENQVEKNVPGYIGM